MAVVNSHCWMKVSASMAARTSASVIVAFGLVYPVTTASGTSTSGAGVGVGTGVGVGVCVRLAAGWSLDEEGFGWSLRQAVSRSNKAKGMGASRARRRDIGWMVAALVTGGV